jgi:hypothetical protein
VNYRAALLIVSLVVSNAVARAADPLGTRAQSRNEFGYDSAADMTVFDPEYPAKHGKYADELRKLQLELANQSSKGRATPCSRQIFLEARWLVFYSAHWDRIEKRLADLRAMLQQPRDPPDAREQVPEDGSFDHCSDAWFLKLDSTIEEVEDLQERGKSPTYPLKILDRINSPKKLRQYLDSVLISDVRNTGIDNRFELNIAITSIERFIVGHVKHDYKFDPDLKRALFEYQDEHWQDPATGYFGGWYRLPDGTVRKTADLSVTFHIASYRRDNLKHVREMMQTTMAFKENEYPFGWREEGQWSNHHNYDVVRLFRIGWEQMDEAQRDQARKDMREMLNFCLAQLRPDGSFNMLDEDTLGSSFLFPISLLNELGYFRPSLRFWTDESFPDAMKLAGKVEHRIKTMGLTDTESGKVLRRFEEARLEQRIRTGGKVLVGVVLAGLALICLRWARKKFGKRAVGNTATATQETNAS